jgi:tetratricopeptide (TPR) repeat protein
MNDIFSRHSCRPAAVLAAGAAEYAYMNTAPDSANRKLGRNDPCTCGSGKKYKKCCAPSGPGEQASRPHALRLAPAESDQLALLADARRYLELEHRSAELLSRHPDAGVVWKLLGLALWMQGKDALEALKKAAELLPDDAESHSNLGNAFRAHGQPEKAIKSHRQALALKSDYAEAHNNLGSALQDLGYLDEATASFRRALALKPEFALAYSNLGNVLTLQNQPLEAEACCHRALEINPRLTGAIVQLAEFQAAKGLFAQAEAEMQRAIAIEPDMPEAWAGLVHWRKMTQGDAAWLNQAQRLVSQRLAPRREAPLRYALGKYFDDIQDYERAVTHFRRANELAKLSGPRHDRHGTARDVDRIIESYDRPWLGRTAGGALSERPVFIVGMWRSGTTLAEQILSSHAAIFGAGELPFWGQQTAVYQGTALNGNANDNAIPRLAERYLTLLDGISAVAPRVLDKMCSNFLHLGLIHAAFPKARIIHMRRNPIDTCLSIYFQNTHLFSNDLDDVAHYYLQYLRVMAHWRQLLPQGTMLEVDYESLVDDQETWSRAMVDFVGLPWDPACRDFGRAQRSISTFSKWQVRQPINRASVERWRNYPQFVQPLRSMLESVQGV